MPGLKSGMNDLLLLNKEIETDAAEQRNTKVVKLRFTRKQFDTFRDACKILEVIASDEEFPDFVKKALGADIKVPTIARQFINPILDAPTRIPVKIPRAQTSGPKKETYFTAPIEATDKCKKLYSHVADDVELKQDIKGEGMTCVTDVRVMVGRYFSIKSLKTEEGVVLDDFIRGLVPEAISYNRNTIQRIKGNYVIPKGDRKVMASIVNEVAMGTF